MLRVRVREMISSYELGNISIPTRQRAIDMALERWITADGQQSADWQGAQEADTEELRGVLRVSMMQFDRLPEGATERAQAELDDEIVAQAGARIRAARSESASRLRALLEAGKFSQRGAARELGIEDRTMRYYCAGDRPIPRAVMLAIEHLVNCSPSNQT